MKSTVIFLALVAGAAQAAVAAEPALMPMPVTMTATSGKFLVNANFVVDTGGSGNALRLAPVVKWFRARIERQTGVPYTPQPPAAADAKKLTIQCAGGPRIRRWARTNPTRWMSPTRVRPSSPPRWKARSTASRRLPS